MRLKSSFLTVTVKPEVLEIRGWSHCFSETISFDLKKNLLKLNQGNTSYDGYLTELNLPWSIVQCNRFSPF
jgi:hypothetical protein